MLSKLGLGIFGGNCLNDNSFYITFFIKRSLYMSTRVLSYEIEDDLLLCYSYRSIIKSKFKRNEYNTDLMLCIYCIKYLL
jgi:hypothetical protein